MEPATPQRRGTGTKARKPVVSPGTLPKAQQNVLYRRHLSQPLADFVVALRQLSTQQTSDVLKSMCNIAPPLGTAFGNMLGALRQARRAEYALATRAPPNFEPSFTELPNITATPAAAVVPDASPRGRGRRRRRSSGSNGGGGGGGGGSSSKRSSSKPGRSVPSSTSTPRKKVGASSGLNLPFGPDDAFPERPLPDAESQPTPSSFSSGTKAISLRLDDSPSQHVKRLTRKEEIEKDIRDKEWVALMNPPSRSSWAAERFFILQQCPCKEFVVGIIREIDPVKQQRTPYRQKGVTDLERPPYWPKDDSVRHTVTPSHLKKEERVNLLVHLLFLPDSNPEYYARWKAEGSKANGRNHTSWAHMLRFVADGTTFRTDGPKLTPKAKAISRGFNLDSSGALCMAPDDQIVKLDRSKFEVSKDEMARIEARLELVGHLINAAARVEQSSSGDGTVSNEQTKMPPLPEYFLEREIGHQMRRTRLRTGRKRKRSSDDDTQSVAIGDGDDGDEDDGDEDEDEDDMEDNADDHDNADDNDNAGDNNNNNNNNNEDENDDNMHRDDDNDDGQDNEDDASDSQSVAATEAYSIADEIEKQQRQAELDTSSDGTRTEVASIAGDRDDVEPAFVPSTGMAMPLQYSRPATAMGQSQHPLYSHQHLQHQDENHRYHRNQHDSRLDWPGRAHYQQPLHMSMLQSPQLAMGSFSASFRSDAGGYVSQTSTPLHMYSMVPHHQPPFVQYSSPGDQSFAPDPSYPAMSMDFATDQTAASSSFGSEAYGVDMMSGYYADEAPSY